MGVVAFFSAKGSPGVTTAALLAAALWPRPALLADCDPAGGDVALRLTRADGTPVSSERGLLSLLPLARREMSPLVLPEHAQQLLGGTEVIAGLGGPEQATAVGPLWPNLAHAFSGMTSHDALLDCGRVHSSAIHLPLLQRADVAVCVLRPTVSGVVHARERVRSLQPVLVAPDGRRPRVGVVIVAEPGADRDVEGALALLSRDLPWVESFGQLALDPRGASMFDGATLSRPERTLLVSSGRRVVSTLAGSLPRPCVLPGPAGTEATEAEPAITRSRNRRRRRASAAVQEA